MNSTQYQHPPQIPLYSPMRAFDLRPIQRHGQNEFGMTAARGRELRIPYPSQEAVRILPKIIKYPGYTETLTPIYRYPNTNEGTGAFMKPPALVNKQVALVSGRTYEIEFEQVKDRLAGMPPIQYNRQWDESYYRYMY